MAAGSAVFNKFDASSTPDPKQPLKRTVIAFVISEQ